MIAGGLVVLAVVASGFLIFSDSVQVLRVGLMAALWAAVIGAIAMTRYRRESAADKAKIRDLQTVYELQLEREISARREYEVGVEARVRSEVGIDGSDIAALRAELAALRGSLEVLFDGRLPADRVAIEANIGRQGRLPAAPAVAAPPVPFAPSPSYADPTAGPTFATPFDAPVTAEVYVVGAADEQTDAGQLPRTATPRPVRRVAPPAAGPTAPPVAARPARPHPPAAPSGSGQARPARPTPEPEVRADRSPAQPLPTPSPPAAPEPSVAAEPEQAAPAAAASDAVPTSRRSRRRVAEEDAGSDIDGAHSNGLTVAEIMANMQAGGADPDSTRTGRRRRE